MKDMRRLRFIVPLVLCLLGTGCGDRQAAPFRRSVMLTEPVQAGAGVLRTFPGTVREAHAVSLGFKTPGQIERVMVQEGDRVRQGQLIATLDDADYRLGVEALEIQYGQLEQEVARMTKLYEGKSLSPNDYEKAVAGLKQVGVQLQVNRNKLDYTRLYAPMDGYVQRVNFSQAEMVDAGTPVVDLLDVRRMEVTVSLPASMTSMDGYRAYYVSSDGQLVEITDYTVNGSDFTYSTDYISNLVFVKMMPVALPFWIWILIAVLALLIILAIILAVVLSKKSKKKEFVPAPEAAAPAPAPVEQPAEMADAAADVEEIIEYYDPIRPNVVGKNKKPPIIGIR